MIALNVAHVVVLVYLAFLTGSLPVKYWKITEINPFQDDHVATHSICYTEIFFFFYF